MVERPPPVRRGFLTGGLLAGTAFASALFWLAGRGARSLNELPPADAGLSFVSYSAELLAGMLALLVVLFLPVFILREIADRRARALRAASPLTVASSSEAGSALRGAAPPACVDPAWGTRLERAAWAVAAACLVFGGWSGGLRPSIRAVLIVAMLVAAFGRLFVAALNARFASQRVPPASER